MLHLFLAEHMTVDAAMLGADAVGGLSCSGNSVDFPETQSLCSTYYALSELFLKKNVSKVESPKTDPMGQWYIDLHE